LAELRAVSARVGRDHLLVQGPGGNTSLKVDGELWVKASGRWLSEALEREIFVRVRLKDARRRWAAGLALDDLAAGDGRPSIETVLHVLMPHPAVIHAHGVNSIATAVLADGERRAADRLDPEVRWAWIEYRRPGRPLAEAVERLVADRDVLLLQNHGVVVGADTPERAEILLRRVERLLELPARELPTGKARIRPTSNHDVLDRISGVAFEPDLVASLTAAALVPDQVVFLGGPVPRCMPGEGPDLAAQRVEAETGVAPALVLAPNVGAFGRRGRSSSADMMIDALYEVARRLPPGAEVCGLSTGDVTEILSWEAEHHRQALDRARS
jgi:rhamnose utilization protein RhaD (predicted bifunctional aldolase and dehydrogenase)